MTRRTALGSLTAALGAAGTLPAQQAPPESDAAKPKFGYSAAKRTTPMLCMFSGNMAKIHYSQIGDIAAQIGFEGIDLTVMIGGHVDPRITNVDLVRAFESIRGSNLEVPMITTAINSPADGTVYPVLYLTGHSQIPLFRLGQWQYGESGDIQQRLQRVRLDLTQIVALAQRCGITAMFPNRAGGFVGEAVWDTQSIIGEMDPRWIGYMFDPAEATAEGGLGGWETALRVALPRLRAVSLQDFHWEKVGDEWKMQKCPLGQGMVDWGKFFSILAAAHFTGPISLQIEYGPQNVMGALGKDLEFARKHVEQAWSATHS
jgi:sugar phosphate isomerase/epimerase